VIGAAVVGLGVGEAHARAYAADGRSELRWVYDLDADRAARVGAELGARVAASLDDILADEETSAVSIASFDDAHFEQVLATLGAGKHVFVEKPLCRTFEEVRSLKDAWERAGQPALASNLVLRSAALFVWLREQLAAGELGTPYAFDGDYLYGRLHKITEGWRGGVDDYSVMLGGGIHLVDLMLWLTGQRPARVSAVGNRISTEGTAFRYDDFVAATFEFDSGLVGRITANFGSVCIHRHVVRVFGTGGAFVSDDAGARLHESRDPGARPRPLELSPLAATKGDLIPGFLTVVEAGGNAADVQHELDVISVCAAADRSLAERRTIDVEYA
jgi:predicted dehydrogenase